MGKVANLVDSNEGGQTQRFRWREEEFDFARGYWVDDTQTGQSRFLGDGVKLFCNDDGDDCLTPGTQQFYDALNDYFKNEQSDIAWVYFNLRGYNEEGGEGSESRKGDGDGRGDPVHEAEPRRDGEGPGARPPLKGPWRGSGEN